MSSNAQKSFKTVIDSLTTYVVLDLRDLIFFILFFYGKAWSSAATAYSLICAG